MAVELSDFIIHRNEERIKICCTCEKRDNWWDRYDHVGRTAWICTVARYKYSHNEYLELVPYLDKETQIVIECEEQPNWAMVCQTLQLSD